MRSNNNLSPEEEKKIFTRQYIMLIGSMTLFIPLGALLIILLEDGGFRYLILLATTPAWLIGFSSVVNRVSIMRPKGRKEPSRGKEAVIFGLVLIIAALIQVLFVFSPYFQILVDVFTG